MSRGLSKPGSEGAQSQTDADEEQGQRQAADDPFAADAVRETGAELSADDDTCGDERGARGALREVPGRNVHQGSGEGHGGEQEVRCGGGGVQGKIKKPAEGRHVDKTAADPEQARNEADEEAEHDADHGIVRIAVSSALRIDQFTNGPAPSDTDIFFGKVRRRAVMVEENIRATRGRTENGR